jgi:hypothetical protein
MAILFCKAYSLIRLVDQKGYLFDKILKWIVFFQNNNSFSSSCHWVGAVVYLI